MYQRGEKHPTPAMCFEFETEAICHCLDEANTLSTTLKDRAVAWTGAGRPGLCDFVGTFK